MSKLKLLFCGLLLLVIVTHLTLAVTFAQDGGESEPIDLEPTPTVSPSPDWSLAVETTATDGLKLTGDFHRLHPALPTVLLLHQLYTNRASWGVLIPSLLGAGFNVLAVDVRGHGATGGDINWPQAVTDVQTWLDWLRQEGGVQGAISIIGSSMGSSLALVGCANDPACSTVIAISPGWDYHGVSVRDAFAKKLDQRPALLIYAERDAWPMRGVPRMVEVATGEVTVETYPGNAHGIDLLKNESETALPLIVNWLRQYGG